MSSARIPEFTEYASILVAIGAGETVQWQDSPGHWHDQDPEVVLAEMARREWSPGRYRIKPKPVLINGTEVPAPLLEAPKKDSAYWLVSPEHPELAEEFTWDGCEDDCRFLARGLIHATYSRAESHARALLSFTRRD